MKVQSAQVVWEALIGKARCRAVLQPKELLEFEHCQTDATGGEAWMSLSTNDTAGLEKEAEERFMLDLLIDVNAKQKEIQELTEQRDELRRHETDEQREKRENRALHHGQPLPPG